MNYTYVNEEVNMCFVFPSSVDVTSMAGGSEPTVCVTQL
jgi:hypothetical protein